MKTTRRNVLVGGVAAVGSLVGGRALAAEETASRGIRVRFLGSGAAGWRKELAAKSPHMRRQSSVLLENRVLIDFTRCSFDMLPKDCRPEVLFQTPVRGHDAGQAPACLFPDFLSYGKRVETPGGHIFPSFVPILSNCFCRRGEKRAGLLWHWG